MLGFDITIARPVRGSVVREMRAATLALIARMQPPPDPARATRIDLLIGTLIDHQIWSRIDTLLLLAAHSPEAALLNWTGGRDAAVGGGDPRFIADRGWWCDGLDDWIDTGLVPASATRFQRNSAMAGCWTRKDGRNATVPVGTIVGTSVSITPRNASDANAGRLNGTTVVSAGSVTTGYGFCAVDRDGAARLRQFVQGRLGATNGSAPSAAPSAATIGLGLANGIAADGQFCAFVGGDSLSEQQHGILYDALADYLGALGVARLPAAASRALSPADPVALPDGSAPITAGNGMAVTGIARDPAGRWYIANGRTTRHALLFTRMTPDMVAIDLEFDVARLGLSSDMAGSCQGITCDTGDGTIWFIVKLAGPDGNRSYLVRMEPETGLAIGTPIPIAAGDNGIAYDPETDGFWIVRDSAELILYDKQGKARTGSFPLPPASDHCFVTGVGHGRIGAGELIVSAGVNGAAGAIHRYHRLDYGGPVAIGIETAPGADAIEGVWLGEDVFHIGNDAATHPGVPAKNRVLRYQL
ncbi:hypothetical protein [Sphingomonas sp. CFBP 13720]|uniref:hypothetical protein n=1 Tax=Sphingomonas sp. CFBP 13720 TaxID=2775302 RepID=UPI001783A846|nr:hypothetical protein [Sphingomonas sp. CFBP 13720]MBD8679974.1 hypothetical protein [Sphingomonas sp. CFBP 13720]